MKQLFKLSVLTLMASVFFACQSEKDAAYTQLKDLYADVEANAKNYTTEDWEKFLDKFEKVDSLISVNEYTPEELEEIGRIKGKCAAYAVKASAKVAGQKFKEAIDEAAGAIDGLMEGLGLKKDRD